MALNYADDTDAKMETFKEILENNSDNNGNEHNNCTYGQRNSKRSIEGICSSSKHGPSKQE